MFRFLGVSLALALAFASAPVRAEAPAPTTSAAPPASAQTVTVFAAASLKNALDSAATAFKAKTGVELKTSYASSMALAKQIESGAPAEVFIAADEASMDYLAGKNLIKADTRSDLLGNSLVVVAPRSSKLTKLPFTKEAFEAAIASGKVATGDPASVPAGKYAKAALEKLDLWTTVEPHFAFTDNVRSALMFVAREEAPLGIVYLTDAKSEPKVKIVATFAANTHPPIVYPIALTSNATDNGEKLLAFLKSKAAKPSFAEQGFVVLK
ncbi:molybdate ABC transporter substrate-binding protein [Methylocystis parvus]|uniref:Molybdate ABC transporter substrate-binding protein n=1 Tax=Methylocystis parvus TaxID=134 RepID=A0A6B8MA04_9HYPH|nr:molybdate ABC transporter substrate-binding protein [Methylocystis parvus]QGM98123.1 molybdate ABC transporter substrate-binding protein [Methylocystis parvus]WBK01555.1 molybdate ABC transporter substrate-binding protein [Methylocystis parvus OBBP]